MLILLTMTSVRADSILLDDGTTVEGTIVREGQTAVVIQTQFGRKTFPLRRIKSIVRDADRRLPRGVLPDAVRHFDNIDRISRECANAEALYELGKYDRIPARLEPYLDSDDKSDDQYRLRWLMIETYERLAQFDKAIEMLEAIEADGRERDKIRARAHLDIFDQNPPDRSLRRVNREVTRKFLKREDRIRAKEPNALADRDLMKAALEEYCYQILSDEDVSIRALRESMDRTATLEALREMPHLTANVEDHLPFAGDVAEVEASLEKVDAILPGYVRAYNIELARTLAVELYEVLEVLFTETVEEYPEPTMSGDERGFLTKEEREEWREYCTEFERAVRPLLRTAEYVQEKVAPYPDNLRVLNQACNDILAQLEQVRSTINRKKGRTRV